MARMDGTSIAERCPWRECHVWPAAWRACDGVAQVTPNIRGPPERLSSAASCCFSGGASFDSARRFRRDFLCSLSRTQFARRPILHDKEKEF